MAMRKYSEVDVFSPTAYLGNPLAVVHDAEGLASGQMQGFAKWTNLAETTFLMQPEDPAADYRVRIFSATQEFPFAGHPTLGSAFAWLKAGGVPKKKGRVIQECAAGLVEVRVEPPRLWFAAPPLTRYEPVAELLVQRIAEVLAIPREQIQDASWLVNGPEWIGVRLSSAQQVLALDPDPNALGTLAIGVAGPQEPGAGTQFEVRAFVGGDPVWEDPATGSLNAGLARWLADSGLAPERYIAAQGTAIGYQGRVHLRVEDGVVWVGGDVNSCVQGEVDL
ncbi:PhzF family phenazine biosynthesis protein [Arthrobacter sp. JUb115]|uniref:PhzF family phenazine biosynthesis protein n=1 Tax=Arthrobacter sp. JUb115 TaxID=2485108 RepID=UPI0010623719|nr:PhzF family phenazine biosynthesis protein [Arthrobacter sp. JUb115]TDU24564.1 PhzF family phenazine biosynthesis protein [Arthrobacter sp. JUb115]